MKSVSDLSKEWRDTVVKRLDKMDETCTDIRLTLSKLTEIDAVNKKVEALESKIRSLEDSRLKAVTMFAVIQSFVFIVWAVLSKTLLK